MIQIFLTIFAIIAYLFFTGFGPAFLLTPKKLKEHILWLIPWYGVMSLIVVLTMASRLGMPICLASPIVVAFLLMNGIYIYLKYKPSFNIISITNIIIFLFIFVSIIFNINPLKKQHFLTTVSLGNNDPITYAKTGDYLVNHSLKEAKDKNTSFEIKDLLYGDYRFGAPIINGFFINVFHLQGYQLTYLLQVILFALSIPLIYILFNLIHKNTLLGTILLLVFYSFNANLLYILYNNFFGQILYWGISIMLLIYFYSNIYLSKDNSFLSKEEISIILFLIGLYFSYQEGIVFIVLPILIFILIRTLLNKSLFDLINFIKVYILTILLAGSSFIHNIIFNFSQFLSPIEKNIGWQIFREKNPFPNLIEIIGLYSIHLTNPLPIFFAVLFSLIIFFIIVYGLLKFKNNLLFIVLFLIYFLFYIRSSIIFPHFFHYYRIVTYTLPIILILFVIGIELFFQKSRLLFILFFIIFIYLQTRWAFRLNKTFRNDYLSVSQSYVSLADLKNQYPKEHIFTENALNPKIIKWNDYWIRYFLKEDEVKKPITDYDLILISKKPTKFQKLNVYLKPIVWENEYYKLGRLCQSDKCLSLVDENLSFIILGKLGYEDSLLLSGWSNKEPENRWANSKKSNIKLVSRENDHFTSLVFEALTLVKPQIVTVFVNNKEIGSQSLDTVWRQYQLFFNERLETGVHKITFKFSNIYQPNKYFKTEDNRQLSANFKKIEFE